LVQEVNMLSAEMLRLRRLQQMEALKPPVQPKPAERAKGEPSFAEVLESEMSAPDVRFSAHAVSRLLDREIVLSKGEIDRIRQGVGKAADKGAKESLVLMDDKAFVVSVENRTVITAITGESLKDNVFTKIDSAVIV